MTLKTFARLLPAGVLAPSAALLFSTALEAGQAPVVAPTAFSPVAAYPDDPNVVSLIVENDSPAGSDKDYTSGVRIGWMSSSASGEDASGWNSFLGAITGGPAAASAWSRFCGMERTPALRQQWGLSLTQLMFTPEDKRDYPIFDQRPYAGYLALGLGSVVKNEDRANSFEFQIGTTGKPSMVKNSQRTVHKILGEERWPGWRYQLPSEFAFNFYFKRYYRLRALEYASPGGFETDSHFYWHADLGTIYLRGGVGMNYRFGYNLPLTGSDASLNGGNITTNPFVRSKPHASNWSYYGYANIAGRVVGHDLFLDGTVFHSSPKYVNKYPFVGDATLGFGVRYKEFDFLFGYTLRSKEYSTQCNPQLIGTLQVRYSF